MKANLYIVNRETRHFKDYFEIDVCNELVTFNRDEAEMKFNELKVEYSEDCEWIGDDFSISNSGEDSDDGTILNIEIHEVNIPDKIINAVI